MDESLGEFLGELLFNLLGGILKLLFNLLWNMLNWIVVPGHRKRHTTPSKHRRRRASV